MPKPSTILKKVYAFTMIKKKKNNSIEISRVYKNKKNGGRY
jgi:hypothetical protein